MLKGMSKFTDEDLELSVESDDDTRISLTLVSLSGKKISMGQFLLELELYLKEVNEAEAERQSVGATTQ